MTTPERKPLDLNDLVARARRVDPEFDPRKFAEAVQPLMPQRTFETEDLPEFTPCEFEGLACPMRATHVVLYNVGISNAAYAFCAEHVAIVEAELVADGMPTSEYEVQTIDE